MEHTDSTPHGTIERCLIIDTETNGLDASKDERIEIALILYSLTTSSYLMSFSTLLPAAHNECEKINRIPFPAIVEIGRLFETIPQLQSLPSDVVVPMIQAADVVVAHNVTFDKQWWRGAIRKKSWVCTLEDFAWPHATRDRSSLLHLAADYEIPIGVTHRALPDCQMIAALLSRHSPEELQLLFAHALRPKGRFMAVADDGGRFPYERKDEAKERGFVWEADDAPAKSWSRWMAIDDVPSLPFRVRRLDVDEMQPAPPDPKKSQTQLIMDEINRAAASS